MRHTIKRKFLCAKPLETDRQTASHRSTAELPHGRAWGAEDLSGVQGVLIHGLMASWRAIIRCRIGVVLYRDESFAYTAVGDTLYSGVSHLRYIQPYETKCTAIVGLKFEFCCCVLKFLLLCSISCCCCCCWVEHACCRRKKERKKDSTRLREQYVV